MEMQAIQLSYRIAHPIMNANKLSRIQICYHMQNIIISLALDDAPVQ